MKVCVRGCGGNGFDGCRGKTRYRLLINVSNMRMNSPMLPVGVRNEGYSLDDAFDELLRWASTDDADR